MKTPTDNRFDRYYAVSPQGEFVWEGQRVVDTDEEIEWWNFVEWNEHAEIKRACREFDDEGDPRDVAEKLRDWGWRMIVCWPVEVEG